MGDHEFAIPTWLNEVFLESVLNAKYTRNNVKVEQFQVTVATKKGDNCGSELFRLLVTSSIGTFSLILKKNFESKEMCEFLKPYDLFGVECRAYAFISQFHEILQEVDEFEDLAPELFYCDAEKEVIMLKDLKGEGYTTGDRTNRMPRETIPVVLRKLAKFHAASIVCNQRRNGELAKYEMDQFRKEGPLSDLFLKHVVAFIDEIKSWGNEFAHLHSKLEYISKNYLKLANQMCFSTRGLEALVHSDLWFNNILIKMDEATGKCLDAKLIDFQLTLWGNLSQDLIHFLLTSLNEEDYQNKFEELTTIYHSHLERVLRKLNYPNTPQLKDLQMEVKEKLFHGLYSTAFAKATIYGIDPSDSSVEGLVSGSPEQFRKRFQNPRLKKEFKFVLNFLDQQGALDVKLNE